MCNAHFIWSVDAEFSGVRTVMWEECPLNYEDIFWKKDWLIDEIETEKHTNKKLHTVGYMHKRAYIQLNN